MKSTKKVENDQKEYFDLLLGALSSKQAGWNTQHLLDLKPTKKRRVDENVIFLSLLMHSKEQPIIMSPSKGPLWDYLQIQLTQMTWKVFTIVNHCISAIK